MRRSLRLGLLMAALLLPMATIVARPATIEAQVNSILAVKCPFDGTPSIWTGKTTIVDGQTWYVMKCNNGHEFLSKTSF